MKRLRVSRSGPVHLGLFSRINLYMLLTVILVLVLVCILLTQSIVYPGLEKDRLLNGEASTQLLNLMSEKYALAFGHSKLLHTQDHVSSRFHSQRTTDSSYFSLTDIRFINTYCATSIYSDEDILDVIIVPFPQSNVFFASSSPTRRASVSVDYTELPEVRAALESEHNISVFYSASQDYMVPHDTQLITFSIKLFDTAAMDYETPIGVMLIHYPLSVFADAYQRLGNLSGGNVYIRSREDTIVFSTDPALLGQPYSEALEQNAEVTRRRISTSGMELVSVVPMNLLRSETNGMIILMLLVLVPAMLLIIGMVMLFNRKYRERLNGLSYAMKNYTANGTHLPIPIRHHDELSELADQFNEMCQRLDQQIKLNYQAELGRKTAELNAMQAQINPHFLFNTIEAIRMRAAEDGNSDISEMLLQLGQLFHWMIQMDQRIVYLEDEIDYNEAYLELQKLRYCDSFEYEFRVPDDVLYLGIPKFSLQPLIENAILHGLRNNSLSGRIIISAVQEGERLYLHIADNGKGMTPERLAQLQTHISGSAALPDFGIGVRNIHTRIQMLFGEDYGVSIKSQYGSGTTVTITLPSLSKKDMESISLSDKREAAERRKRGQI